MLRRNHESGQQPLLLPLLLLQMMATETGTTSADQKAIAARDAALKKGIFVDVMTDADLIQTTGLVGGPTGRPRQLGC